MERTRRATLAFAAVCVIGPAGPAVANLYGAPGSLTDAESRGGGLGSSVSLSGDGSLAVVGEPGYNGGAGAALVYAESHGSWSFVQRLTPSDETGAGHFGAAVSVDNWGQALLVGAPEDNAGGGSAWVFVLSDGTWTEQAHLTSSLYQAGAKFGTSVALASGGALALIGVPLMNPKGQALTFEYQLPWGWYQRQQMPNLADLHAGARFGASVALDSNGGRGIVGAPNEAGGNGTVYTYSHFGLESPNWIPSTIISSPAPGGNFGANVTLSLLGDHELIGAPLADTGDGAVYEYRPDGTREATFGDPSGAGTKAHFGASLAVARGTMDELVVGAPNGASGAGAVYEFDAANGANWLLGGGILSPLAPPELLDAYGSGLAVSAEASTLLVGSPGASSADGLVTHFTSNLTAPDAPTAVHAVAASESADVVWSAPLDDGGMPITEYTVTSSPEGRMCYGSGSGSLQCALAGLTNGQTYTFTVTATNARGPSDPSAPSNAVTPQASVVGGGGDPSKDAPRGRFAPSSGAAGRRSRRSSGRPDRTHQAARALQGHQGQAHLDHADLGRRDRQPGRGGLPRLRVPAGRLEAGRHDGPRPADLHPRQAEAQDAASLRGHRVRRRRELVRAARRRLGQDSLRRLRSLGDG